MKSAVGASALLALVACGSSDKAPIEYGANGTSTGRVYNSPQEIYQKQAQVEAAARAQRTQVPPAPAYAQPRTVAAPVQAAYAPAPQPVNQRGKYIEVQPGDTVYAIARRFQVSPNAVIAENGLLPPYALSIGQALRLPSNTQLASSAVSNRKVVAQDRLYTVRRGDTLFSISRRWNVPVQTIAQANRLSAPYPLSVGQQILVPQAGSAPQPARMAAAPVAPQARAVPAPANARDVGDLARSASITSGYGGQFAWPLRGAVISQFGMNNGGKRNDGVNISAPAGTPVRAAADGEVVYRGDELDGYGNLLLVKHDGGFVTAYAHNDAMLVRKGQKVRRGQVIAKVGQSGGVSTPQLHFEVRQDLQAIDPIAMLGRQ